jgi:hypothetical protein
MRPLPNKHTQGKALLLNTLHLHDDKHHRARPLKRTNTPAPPTIHTIYTQTLLEVITNNTRAGPIMRPPPQIKPYTHGHIEGWMQMPTSRLHGMVIADGCGHGEHSTTGGCDQLAADTHLLVPNDSLQLSAWQQRSNTVNSNKVNLKQQHAQHRCASRLAGAVLHRPASLPVSTQRAVARFQGCSIARL